MAGPCVWPVIPHRTVLHATIVPKCYRVFPPAKATLEQRIFGKVPEVVQDGVALIARHTDDTLGEAAIDVERPLSRHRMRADHRMLSTRIAGLLGHTVVGVSAAIRIL